MLFNNPLLQRRIIIFKHLRKTINFSSQTTSSTWVQNNQLFQRHPKLKLLEEPRNRTFHHLKQLLSYVFVSGLHRNPFVMSRFLYTSLIQFEGTNATEISQFGIQIFDSIENPNTFSWNSMIRFFALHDPVIAVDYYTKMLTREMVPDKYTFPFLLQACGANLDLGLVKQVHCHALKLDSVQSLYVQNSLLSAYLSSASAIDAWLVFDEMPERDVVSWTSLISGLVSQSNHDEAIRVFREMLADDCKVKPNDVTVISTTSACGSLGSIDLTKCLHSFLVKTAWLELDVSLVNSLLDAYAKCGYLCCARKVFDEIEDTKRDLYYWTAIISGYAMHGQGLEALNMFSQMEQVYEIVPDAVTLVAVLSACAHCGLVEEGLTIFESMRENYRIDPDLRHYGCIVDLLGRAGMIERAYDIIENMPIEPNLAVLGSLLNGCRLHNNLELGKAVLRKIELFKERGGASVLLSNMYANENLWGEVIRIRKEMRGVIEAKPPGRSWIQIKGMIHEFIARNDTNDAKAMELHTVLEGLEKLSRL